MPLDVAGREPGAPGYEGPAHHSAPSGEGTPSGKGGSKLSKKLGPLPLWGWGVVGAAVLGFLYYRSRSGGTTSASSATGATGTIGSVPVGSAQDPVVTGLNDLVHAQQAVIQSLTPGASAAGATVGTQVGAAPGSTPVSNLYSNLLGRSPDAGGATFFGGELGANPTSQSVLQAFQQVASSPEGLAYAASHPQDFWTGAYREVLNREPDAAGIQYWQHLAQTTSQQNATQQFALAAKKEEGLK